MTLLGSGLLMAAFVALASTLTLVFVLVVVRARRTGHLEASAVRWTVFGAVAWLSFWGALGASDALDVWHVRPPPGTFALLGLFAFSLALGLSRFGAALGDSLRVRGWIFWHTFRLPLELVMWWAALEGVMPEHMSLAGYNFDVVTGAFALVLGSFSVFRPLPRWAAWLFNIVGIVLLLVILTIAMLSTPLVQAFGPERLNTWVTHFPYIYLPAVMVQFGVFGHVVLTRKLIHAGKPIARTRRPQRGRPAPAVQET